MIARCSAQYRGTMKVKVSMSVLSASSVQILHELCFVCCVTMEVNPTWMRFTALMVSTTWMGHGDDEHGVVVGRRFGGRFM